MSTQKSRIKPVYERTDRKETIKEAVPNEELRKIQAELVESRNRYLELFECAPVGFFIVGKDDCIRDVNSCGAQMLGYDRAALIDSEFKNCISPEFRAGIRNYSDINSEIRMERKDGTKLWAEITVGRKCDGGAGGSHSLIVVRDVTRWKESEDALKSSEERYRTLVDNAPIGISITTPDGRTFDRNKAVQQMHGFVSKEEMMRLSPVERYFDPNDRRIFLDRLEKGPVFDFEVRLKRKDGSNFWASLTAIPQVTASGEKQMLTITQNIDERKQSEEALKKSENKFRNLFENLPIGLALIDSQGHRIEVNKAFREMHGYKSREEFLAFNHLSAYPDQKARQRFLELLKQDKAVNFEVRRRRKDGSVFWAHQTAIPQYDDSGDKHYIISIQDITDRKQMDESLKASEQKFRSLFENAPVGISITNSAGKAFERNNAAMLVHGYSNKEEFMKVNGADLYYDSEDRMHFLELLKKGPVKDFEARRRRRDGSIFWALVTAIPFTAASGEMQLISVTQDITERKLAEDALKSSRQELRNLSAHLEDMREAERTRIAREIHDELGQSLTAIRLDLAWLKTRVPSSGHELFAPKLDSLISYIDLISNKVREIASELRPGVLDDFGLIAAMEWTLQEFLKRTGIKVELSCRPGEIILDKTLETAIYRIFQEALTNAARHSGATVLTVDIELSEKRITLRVTDNGCGIRPEKISSPTSLGLIGMRERVYSHGGTIEFSGEAGKGTVITVVIPVTGEADID